MRSFTLKCTKFQFVEPTGGDDSCFKANEREYSETLHFWTSNLTTLYITVHYQKSEHGQKQGWPI